MKLMGFTEEDVKKCKDVGVSKTQLYKQSGNSIVVDCIKLIWEHVFKAQYDQNYIPYDDYFTFKAQCDQSYIPYNGNFTRAVLN